MHWRCAHQRLARCECGEVLGIWGCEERIWGHEAVAGKVGDIRIETFHMFLNLLTVSERVLRASRTFRILPGHQLCVPIEPSRLESL